MIAKDCLDKWTFEAILCYRIGCMCSRCPNKSLASGCKMKATVLSLVRKFGAPNDFLKKHYLPRGLYADIYKSY